MKSNFNELAYKNTENFIFGHAKNPVEMANGMVIGGGTVYPEINFTLSSMSVNEENMPEIRKQYREIVEDICDRCLELKVPGLVVEIEILPAATYNADWGEEIVEIVREVLDKYEANRGLKSLLRVTPVDIREDMKSDNMWTGEYWDKLMEVFTRSARSGADLLSIESIGGKNLHDEALMYCEIDKSLFSLGVLGVKDMSHLWSSIVEIAKKNDTIAAGDTACAFANTAMVLGDKGMIPKVFSAVVRVMSAVRSLVALEEGAVGPHKDCGYEGVYIKAITGTPISMEGKTSAVAHLSPVGNIASCVADLWSNESVQNVKLLGGMAPTISMEQLAYDCRLMNTAIKGGHKKIIDLRDLFSESDKKLDPNAYVLDPEVVINLAHKIVQKETLYRRMITAGLETVKELRRAIENDLLMVDEKEIQWLDIMEDKLGEIPLDESKFIAQMVENYESEKFKPEKYNL
ncbi:MAG: methyltransferase MtaB domain-containing protein [Bacillota bacterium]